MASVLTPESVEHLKLKIGAQVALMIKAVHILPVKEDTKAVPTSEKE